MVVKTVYLNDDNIPYELADEYFKEAADWAKTQCSSFLGYTVQDVSDVSLQWDNIAEYNFGNEKDVIFFQLRWKNS